MAKQYFYLWIRVCSCSLSLLLSGQCGATYEAPWIDEVYLPIASLSTSYQYFNHINNQGYTQRYPGRDALIEGQLYFAYTSTTAFELESMISRTHAHPWVIDHLKESIKYILFDDVEGDPIACSLGLFLLQPFSVGLHDPSIIHHGYCDIEAHVALGKEYSQGPYWNWRMYGLGSIGITDRGSPWTRGVFSIARNWNNIWYCSAQVKAQMGFGSHQLNLNHFHGYAKIAYRVLEACINGGYQTVEGYLFSSSLSYRIYARNTPLHVLQCKIEITYPFNL